MKLLDTLGALLGKFSPHPACRDRLLGVTQLLPQLPYLVLQVFAFGLLRGDAGLCMKKKKKKRESMRRAGAKIRIGIREPLKANKIEKRDTR